MDRQLTMFATQDHQCARNFLAALTLGCEDFWGQSFLSGTRGRSVAQGGAAGHRWSTGADVCAGE
jgi:hypothetical protein